MRRIKYGTTEIEYSFHENEKLKSHYITVEKNRGVILKGKTVTEEKSDQLILKKANWIIEKLDLVADQHEMPLVTGSRIQYLGRAYYVEIVVHEAAKPIEIAFNQSKFSIRVPTPETTQEAIKEALEDFYTQKAKEKIPPRLKKLSDKTKLDYEVIKFRKLEKSWGNCSPRNIITINPHAIKLPYSLIDYLLVHELCHTRVKDHSKQFWAELSKHLPDWRELNERVELVKG